MNAHGWTLNVPEMKMCHIIPFFVIAALGGPPFVVPLFSPWSRINCT